MGRWIARIHVMVVTLVLRLLPGPLEHGELVGRAEVVATGESVALRGVADLVDLARAAASQPANVPAEAVPQPASASLPVEDI
jgi:hypothetical protein